MPQGTHLTAQLPTLRPTLRLLFDGNAVSRRFARFRDEKQVDLRLGSWALRHA
jgi:hypothetical protein